MNKKAKVACMVLAFVVLIGAAAFTGYYFATGKTFLKEKAPVTDETGTADNNKKEKAYDLMEEPSYNEYALEYIKIGNLMGNLLNGGMVVPTQSNLDQSIPGAGVYRFNQESEDTSPVTILSETGAAPDYYSLNRIDGYIIFIDRSNNCLYSARSNGEGPYRIADDVQMCFVYDQTAYFTSEKGVYMVDVRGGEVTKLYEKEGYSYKLVGLSNSWVYFSAEKGGTYQWLAVHLKSPGHTVNRFLEDTKGTEVTGAQYSDGWLYYLKGTARGSDLYRRHIGVDDETKLAEGIAQYVVDKNCVYYGQVSDGVYNVRELNTDSGAVKIVLTVPVTDEKDLVCYVAGEYVFAVGVDADGGLFSCSTCLWTAANDLRRYSNENGSPKWDFERV